MSEDELKEEYDKWTLEANLRGQTKKQAGTWWLFFLVALVVGAAGQYFWAELFPDDPWLIVRRLVEKVTMVMPGLLILTGMYLVLDRILHFNISEVVKNDPRALALLVGCYLLCGTLLVIYS